MRRITELSVVHVLRQFGIDEHLTHLVRSHRHRAPSGRFSHLQQDPLWHKLQPVKGRLREVPVLPLGHRPLLRARDSLDQQRQMEHPTGASAPYTTRIAVYRPINPKRFNGTVVVEWLNVCGGTDDAPEWTLSHNELVRDGFAWVGVSAQKVGVDSAKSTDPAEYSSLSHPGDSFSYDMFSQAGQAVRADAALILAGLRPHTLIAAGESQSAGLPHDVHRCGTADCPRLPRVPRAQPIWYWRATLPSTADHAFGPEPDDDPQ